jgi:hypothetical protein
MEIIAHRRNLVEQLQATPTNFGVEVDIRSHGTKLIVQHDPFCDGEDFEKWLKHFRHGLLVANVKEEGLEDRVIQLLNDHKIERFFFLDQSFPFLIKTAKKGERRCAARISEYESIDTALRLAGLIEWIWVDCFTRMPLSPDQASELRRNGFKLCFVSPELQGRSSTADLEHARREIAVVGAELDAVCTKRVEFWA